MVVQVLKKGARKGYAKLKYKKILMYMCLYSCTPHQGPGLAPQLELTSTPITFGLQTLFLVLINILSLGALSERSQDEIPILCLQEKPGIGALQINTSFLGCHELLASM